MGNRLVSLALTASLLGAPVLSLANHPHINSLPVLEGEYIVDVEGANTKFGHGKFYKLKEGDHDWDFFTYTPYCNSKLGHPFYTIDKTKDEVIFYKVSGEEIKRMSCKEASKLPELWLYQGQLYKCSELEHVNPKLQM